MNLIDRKIEVIDKKICQYTQLINDLWKERDLILGVTKVEPKKTKRICDMK